MDEFLRALIAYTVQSDVGKLWLKAVCELVREWCEVPE